MADCGESGRQLYVELFSDDDDGEAICTVFLEGRISDWLDVVSLFFDDFKPKARLSEPWNRKYVSVIKFFVMQEHMTITQKVEKIFLLFFNTYKENSSWMKT